ncbi:MAG: hypothetical protein ACREMD_05405 [Gemmatimonadota bacterium]
MTVRSTLHTSLLLAALLPVACEPVPSAPEDSVRFDPPAIYRQWYREAEECRGLGGDYGLLRFYLVPNSGTHMELGILGAIGLWAPPHRIYVLEDHDLDEPMIKHEMLHDLLSYVGDFTHNDSLAFRVCDLTDEGGAS